MLRIMVPMREHFKEETNEFVTDEFFVLELEHSLVALSKWEQIHKKPFLSEGEKSVEEMLSYIECMIVNPNFPPEVFQNLTQADFDSISDYMNDKATATWFNEPPNPPRSSEVLTSELIYYWMFSNGIDKECENWHLQRLITLLKIFNFKNSKPRPMGRDEMLRQRRELNARRKAELGTSG